MEFFRRAAGVPRKLGVFPGTFNPPTRAHLALAQAALEVVDEVVLVLPREFPHKQWEGVPFADRVRMLDLALVYEPRFSIAATQKGLFTEIARECSEVYAAELYFLCGRDAAERIVNWDYGQPGAIHEQLAEFKLLVARRQGDYTPPPELRHAILPLAVPAGYDECSATEVRTRIRDGAPWTHLVPDAIVDVVRSCYSCKP